MRTLAHFFSILLHPLWMPTITIVLCFRLDPHLTMYLNQQGSMILFAMVFVMTAIFPLTSTWWMVRNGLASSVLLPERKERTGPYVLTLLYYVLAYYLLRRTPNHPAMWCIFIGAMLSLLITLLITLRWKISVHMVGIGGLLGAVVALTLIHDIQEPLVIAALLVLAGALGTARLVASDHSPAQVYAGALLGFACVMGCALLGVYL